MMRANNFRLKPLTVELPLKKTEIPMATVTETEAAASSTCAAPPWTELPQDVTANILQRLGAEEILQSAQKVCATWWRVSQNPAMWRVINIINPEPGLLIRRDYCTNICRSAVDRSQGQLIDLTIEYFGDDELLGYIADRSSKLRRLTIACWTYDDISGTAVTEAVKQLPELEELHLLTPIYVEDGDLETIGVFCPMLKSFTFNRPHCWGNEDALEIAKKMPNLCNLRLFNNGLNNDGLQAILDGCPHLESLDLRGCDDVDLGGALGKRICERIEDLRLPSDSLDDYDYEVYDDVDEALNYVMTNQDFDYDSDRGWY